MVLRRVYGAAPATESVAERLAAVPGVAHLTRADSGDGFGRAPVTADVQRAAADAALASLDDLDIQAEDGSLSL